MRAAKFTIETLPNYVFDGFTEDEEWKSLPAFYSQRMTKDFASSYFKRYIGIIEGKKLYPNLDMILRRFENVGSYGILPAHFDESQPPNDFNWDLMIIKSQLFVKPHGKSFFGAK